MITDDEIVQNSIQYLNQNKKAFLAKYTEGISATDDKVAFFTAGMSGVGKTELAIFLKERNPT